MSKKYFLICAVALVAMASCENDDTDFSNIINSHEDIPEYVLPTIEFDDTALDETEIVPADDNDYEENSTFSRTVTITYNGNTASVDTTLDQVGVSIDGAHVTVNSELAGVNYVLKGNTVNGSFKVYSEHRWKLTLNGVSITNLTGAAVNNQCGKSLYAVLADGTTNTLTDGAAYTNTPAGEDEKGTLFSEGQIIFSGKGRLNVTGNYRNGIASDDYIVFRPGNVIRVDCPAKNCIKANDGVSVRGGVLNLSSTGNGGKAINSESDIDITGGRLTAIVSGNTLAENGDTTSVAALKSDSSVVITGGTVELEATGDGGKGIRANEDIIIGGGSLTVEALGEKGVSAPKGIKADGNISFQSGSSYIYSANSTPIDEGKTLIISDSLTASYSSDEKLVEIK